MFLSKAGSLSKQNFMPIVPLAAKIYHWLYEYAFWGTHTKKVKCLLGENINTLHE